jgi:insulysin
LIHSTPNSELFFLADYIFETPKLNFQLLFHLPKNPFFDDISHYASLILFKSFLDQYLKEFSYMASLAQAKIEFSIFEGGFKLFLSGFNHKFSNFLDELANRISDFCVATENIKAFLQKQFEILKLKKIEELDQKIKAQPYKQYKDVKNYLFQPSTYSSKEMINQLEDLSFEEYLERHIKIFRKVYLESFISGNLSKTNANEFKSKFLKPFLKKDLFNNLAIQELNQFRVVDFKRRNIAIYEHTLENEHETNNLISLYFQLPQEEEAEYINMILKSFLRTAFFNEMRTQKQYGYIVAAFNNLRKNISAFSFLIQSQNLLPSELSIEIFDFLIRQRKRVNEITEQKFEELKKGAIATFKEKFLSLKDQSIFNFDKIETHSYHFTKKDDAIKEIEDFSKEDLIKHFERIFFAKRKILEFHFVNKESRESNFQHVKKRKGIKLNGFGALPITFYSNAKNLQNDHSLYVDSHRKKRVFSEL